LNFFNKNHSLIFLLGLYLTSSLFMIDKYPRVWVDEPWESITAYTLEHEGRLYNPVLAGRDGYGEHFLEPRLLLSIVVAGFFALFGTGLLQARLASVLMGGLLLTVGYLFGRRFFSKRAGLFITWCFWIETMIFIAARTVRPEIYLATIELVSLYFFFSGIKKGIIKNFFWAGIFAGISLWTHPNAILFVAGICVVFLRIEKLSIMKSTRFWVFVLGTIIAFSPYAAYVIVEDAHNGFVNFWSQLAGRPGEIMQAGWLRLSLWGEWRRLVEFIQFPYRILVVTMYIYLLVRSFFSQHAIIKSVLIFIAVEFILSVALISNKSILYSSTFLPLLIILAAKYFDDNLPDLGTSKVNILLSKIKVNNRFVLAIILFCTLSLNQLVGNAYLLWSNRYCSYAKIISNLRDSVPHDARVWGSMTFWFAFREQPYRTQYTYLNDFDTFKPQYIITGDTEVWGKSTWANTRAKVDSIVTARGTLYKKIPTECYGSLRIYRIRW
jgi:hypothetical protein